MEPCWRFSISGERVRGCISSPDFCRLRALFHCDETSGQVRSESTTAKIAISCEKASFSWLLTCTPNGVPKITNAQMPRAVQPTSGTCSRGVNFHWRFSKWRSQVQRYSLRLHKPIGCTTHGPPRGIARSQTPSIWRSLYHTTQPHGEHTALLQSEP